MERLGHGRRFALGRNGYRDQFDDLEWHSRCRFLRSYFATTHLARAGDPDAEPQRQSRKRYAALEQECREASEELPAPTEKKWMVRRTAPGSFGSIEFLGKG